MTRVLIRWLFLPVFCLICFAAPPSQTDAPPRVIIDAGVLEGARFGAAPNEVMFLGIPFAAPPAGDRRWIRIGMAASLAVSRLLKGSLFGLSAADPMTFGISPLLLAAVALLACYVPAQRAAKVDPMIALRAE
jgi:Carboxylesterase family